MASKRSGRLGEQIVAGVRPVPARDGREASVLISPMNSELIVARLTELQSPWRTRAVGQRRVGRLAHLLAHGPFTSAGSAVGLDLAPDREGR
jgi:hypothetical protein